MKRHSVILAFLVTACSYLVVGCSGCNGGGGNAANSIPQQLKKARAMSNKYDRAMKLVVIADQQIKASDGIDAKTTLEEAAQVAEQLDIAQRARVQIDIARIWRTSGFKFKLKNAKETAIDTIDQIEDPGDRAETLTWLALLQKEVDDLDEAEESLQQAEALVKKIADAVRQVEVMVKIGKRYNSLELGDEAKRVLNAAAELALSNDRVVDQCSGLGRVAVAQTKLGQTEEADANFAKASELFEAITDEDQSIKKLNAMAVVAEHLQQAGKNKQAFDLAIKAQEMARVDKNAEGTLKERIQSVLNKIPRQ